MHLENIIVSEVSQREKEKFTISLVSLYPWKESYEKPGQCIKKQRHHFANKGTYSQSYGFSSSHVQMWEVDHKEGWVLKNWCFQSVVLEKTLESPLDSKDIKPISPKGDQPWIFIGRTEAKVLILWPPDAKSQFIGKDWCWERLKAGEGGDRGWDDWMVSWILNGHEFQQILGVSEGQGSLECCSSWGLKESDTTEQLNKIHDLWQKHMIDD